MTRRSKRRWGVRLLAAGAVFGLFAAVSEWRGAQWWSRVDLARLRQRFAMVRSGQIIAGTRGTAGFFNRGIPEPGPRFLEPRRFDPEPWSRRVLPRWFSTNQTRGASVPLVSPALVLAGAGCLLVRCARRPGNACANCGYDLSGLDAAACPECGWPR